MQPIRSKLRCQGERLLGFPRLKSKVKKDLGEPPYGTRIAFAKGKELFYA